jgi:ABC-2 type transport system ATP-binding protein
MKRRLEIGRGLIHEPKVLFLDEPTIGLDAQTRRHIWNYIKKLNSAHNVTIILTTHYIEEADYLADRVAFIDHGKIVALDTPRALKDKLGGDIISMQVQKGLASLEGSLGSVKWIKAISTHNDRMDLTVDEGEHQIPKLILLAEKHKAIIDSIELHKPSLEDVFLHYTGKNIREEEGEGWKGRIRAMHAKRNR